MLELKQLKLENIGKIRNKTITFEKGTNLIDAPNGSGKSTILNTISMLLLNKYDGNLENTLNNSSDNGSAELNFVYNNDNYISSIELKKEKKTVKSIKSLIKNGNVIAEGEDVEKELNKILPPVLTEFSLFNKQKGTRLTNITDSERRDVLTQLCELDYSQKVKENIENEIDNIKQIISDKEKEEYALKNKQYNFGEEKEILVEWNDENENQLNEFKEKQKLYERNNELRKRILDLNYKVHDLHDDLERKQLAYNIDKLTEENTSQLKKLESDHKVTLFNLEENYLNTNNSMDKQISDIQNEIENIENQLSNIKLVKLVKFNEDELNEKRKEYTELTTKSKIAFKNAEQLANKVCPICGGNCEGKHDEFENEGKSLEKQSIECEGIISDLQNKKKEYELKKEENDKNKSLKENLTIKLDSLKEKLEDMKSHKEKLHEDYNKNIILEDENYNKSIISCNSLFEEKKNNAKTIIENAQRLYDDAVKELNSIDSVDNSIEDYTNQIKVYEKNKQNYFELVSYNKAIVENNEKLIIEQKEDKEKLTVLEKELLTLKDKLSDYTLSKEIMLKTFPTWSLEKISDGLVSEINEMIESIYDKSLNIKFDANKNSLKMTYNVNGDRDLPVIKLSGAEDNLTNIAVQSTFNKRQGLNCILLDECDNFCSDKTAESFYDCLLELSNIYNQMIVITHKQEMKNRFVQNGCNVIRL